MKLNYRVINHLMHFSLVMVAIFVSGCKDRDASPSAEPTSGGLAAPQPHAPPVSAAASPAASPNGKIGGEVFIKTFRNTDALAGARIYLFDERFIDEYGKTVQAVRQKKGEVKAAGIKLRRELAALRDVFQIINRLEELELAKAQATRSKEEVAKVTATLEERLRFFVEKKPTMLEVYDPFHKKAIILDAWARGGADKEIIDTLIGRCRGAEKDWSDRVEQTNQKISELESEHHFQDAQDWRSGKRGVDYFESEFSSLAAAHRSLLEEEEQLAAAQEMAEPAASVIIDRNGLFTLSNIKPGKYALVFHFDLFDNTPEGQQEYVVCWYENIELLPGQEITDIRLAQANAAIYRNRLEVDRLRRHVNEKTLGAFLKEFLAPKAIDASIPALIEEEDVDWKTESHLKNWQEKGEKKDQLVSYLRSLLQI